MKGCSEGLFGPIAPEHLSRVELAEKTRAEFAMLIALTAFEIMVSFLQAYVFAILAAVYIGGAAHPEH